MLGDGSQVSRKGLGTSRADVSGNARHFCDCELNYTGYEGERSGLNHWTETTEGTCNVLRTFREVDVSHVSPSSTTQNVSIIYQLFFINKKNNIPYKVYCFFHILRSSPKDFRNG